MNFKNVSATLLFTGLVLIQSTAFAEMVSIRGDDINMRSGPGAKYEVLWKMGNGFPLEVVQTSGSWLKVKDFENSVGWVSTSVTSKAPYAVVSVNKGKNTLVNVRSAPNEKSGSVVATAAYGVVFKVLEKKSGWVKVEHANGVTGWIRGDLLWGE